MRLHEAIRRNALIALAAAALLAAPGSSSGADRWRRVPDRTTADSRSGALRFTVVPARDFGEQETAPLGILERRAAGGPWSLVWIRPLANRISPLEAVVSDDARFVVTFDDVPDAGGDLAVVVYDAQGRTIRRQALSEIFSEAEIERFPRRGDSVLWRCRPARLDGSAARLELGVPLGTEDSCETFSIDLTTGRRTSSPAPHAAATEGSAPAHGEGNRSDAAHPPLDPAMQAELDAYREALRASAPPILRAVQSAEGRRGGSSARAEDEALAAVEAALRDGAAIDAQDETGATALHVALAMKFHRVAAFLLEHGASWNPPDDGGMLFGDAIAAGDTQLVKAFLRAGADPSAPLMDGTTPLGHAVLAGREDVLQVLLSAGADPNRPGASASPLEDSLVFGWWRGADLLVAAGASPSGLSPDARLRWAVETGDAAAALEVLRAHPPLVAGAETPESVLARAAERGDIEMLRALLSEGGDPSRASGLFGTTPLIEAAQGGHLDAMRALLAAGADVNGPDRYGFRALDVAMLFGRDEAAALLREHGGSAGIPLDALNGATLLRDDPVGSAAMR